jgi:hypothetical protein
MWGVVVTRFLKTGFFVRNKTQIDHFKCLIMADGK